jgi:hypothetical protein
MVVHARHLRTSDLRRENIVDAFASGRAADATLEGIVTMATTAERVEQLLTLMREVDLPTLLELDCKLHLLLEQRREAQPRTGQTTAQEEFCRRYPRIAVDHELFALVGIHAENPVEADKPLIREQIS